jgi:hypothetical protein
MSSPITFRISHAGSLSAGDTIILTGDSLAPEAIVLHAGSAALEVTHITASIRKAAAEGLVLVSPPVDTVTRFTDLEDVPSSYDGSAGKGVQVNPQSNGLKFGEASGGGDYSGHWDLSLGGTPPEGAAEGKVYYITPSPGTYAGKTLAVGDTVRFVNGTADVVVTSGAPVGPIKHVLVAPFVDWAGAGPYVQTFPIVGLTATDTALLDIDLSSVEVLDVDTTERDYGKIYRAVLSTDSVMLYATEAPTIDLTLTLTVI